MKKSVPIVVWILLGLFCACGGACGLGGLLGVKGYQQAASGIGAELQPLVTQVVSDWDPEVFASVATPEAKARDTDAVRETRFKEYLEKFGKGTSAQPGAMTNISTSTVNGVSKSEATVGFMVTCEKGTANLTVTARKQGGVWKIDELTVHP